MSAGLTEDKICDLVVYGQVARNLFVFPSVPSHELARRVVLWFNRFRQPLRFILGKPYDPSKLPAVVLHCHARREGNVGPARVTGAARTLSSSGFQVIIDASDDALSNDVKTSGRDIIINLQPLEAEKVSF